MCPRLSSWIKGHPSANSTATPSLYSHACYLNAGPPLMFSLLYFSRLRRKSYFVALFCIFRPLTSMKEIRPLELFVHKFKLYSGEAFSMTAIFLVTVLLWAGPAPPLSAVCFLIAFAMKKFQTLSSCDPNRLKYGKRVGDSFDYILPQAYFYTHNTAHWPVNCSPLLYFRASIFSFLVGLARQVHEFHSLLLLLAADSPGAQEQTQFDPVSSSLRIRRLWFGFFRAW